MASRITTTLNRNIFTSTRRSLAAAVPTGGKKTPTPSQAEIEARVQSHCLPQEIDYNAAIKNGTPVTIDNRAIAWSAQSNGIFSERNMIIAGSMVFLVVLATNVHSHNNTPKTKFVIDPEYLIQQANTIGNQDAYAQMKRSKELNDNSIKQRLEEKIPLAQLQQQQAIEATKLANEQKELEEAKAAL